MRVWSPEGGGHSQLIRLARQFGLCDRHKWRSTIPQKDAKITWDHIARSPACRIRKAGRLLQYHPRYSSLEAVRESVMWLVDNGLIEGRIPEVRAGVE